MNVDGDGEKELQELKQRLPDRNKGVKDGVVGEEQGLHKEYELKVNAIANNAKDGHRGTVQAPARLQMPQQQPRGAMVCWERFLHVRSLKVLLVEDDDSTRHVVTALLRNCGYEVTIAANGLQAWKILEDLSNHIDLVLTEVVMPCLSGIGLMSKIMSHRTRQNVPVIMMSSHDSMGLVFKCLSKGAVDFLVKPIRKNELKNLWQHVWRRCHSSSGSGSESGTQTQKSVKSKSVEKSNNNTGSSDEDDNGSTGLNVGDGSDDGSGTQSSWTKQDVEVDSPRPISPWDRVAVPNSTCAQAIHSNAEITGDKLVPLPATKECQEQDEQLDNASMGKDLEISVPRNLDLQLEYPVKVPIKLLGTKQNNLHQMCASKFIEQIDKGQLDLNRENLSGKQKSEAANLTGVISMASDLQDSADYEAPKRLSNDKVVNATKELPSLEIGLKRLRGVKDIGTTVQDDRNVLRRSDSSAFLRCYTASNENKAPSRNIESNFPHDNSLDVMKIGSISDIRYHANDLPNQCSKAGSNNIDIGSATNNAPIKPVTLNNKSAAASTVKCSALQPCPPEKILSDKADDMVATRVMGQPRGAHQELQVQHFSHHYDRRHHRLVHNMPEQPQMKPPGYGDLSLKKMAAVAPHCGSSNVLGGAVEGNAGNYSVNGSASSSKHRSNSQNESTMNAVGTNIEYGKAGRSGIADASGSGSGNRADQSKFSQREAALTKFLQKRKERFFRRKVRYQNRKRLAEQRPRIRGQFVRQTMNENASRETES